MNTTIKHRGGGRQIQNANQQIKLNATVITTYWHPWFKRNFTYHRPPN